MHLKYPIQELLLQLRDVLENLSNTQYAAPAELLSGASIGQHVRHIVEFFEELAHGYGNGTINYDRRNRNHVLEINRYLAIQLLSETMLAVDRPDKDLLLIAHVSPGNAEPVVIRTNYFRELLYNIEHMVHHMALLRIGINEVADIELPDHFGVAASTLKFRQACAQ
jgi:uncharacterized damage-inducible protein DinB